MDRQGEEEEEEEGGDTRGEAVEDLTDSLILYLPSYIAFGLVFQ